MNLSLLNRFQGGLLGYLLAVTLRNNQLSYSQVDTLNQEPHYQSKISLESGDSAWINILINVTECLIKSNTVQPADWQQIQEKYQFLFESQSDLLSIITVITTPLSLYYHDNPAQLRQELDYCFQIWEQSSENQESIFSWHRGIALILREKAEPNSLIEEIIAVAPQPETTFIKQLKKTKEGLEAGISLKTLINTMKSDFIPLILALTYVSDTPSDFRVSVLRAQKYACESLITTLLTAVLAGVYNGWSGVPVDWRLELQNSKTTQIIHQQASRLLAVWAGVLQLRELNTISEVAIASPKVIQYRPLLQIISQENL